MDNIEQKPILIKNDYKDYRKKVKIIRFIVDYVDEWCFQGQDMDMNHQLYFSDKKNIVKLNHNYKHYKRGKKVIFPYHQKAYIGYLVKKGQTVSQCIDEQFGIMFRVPTEKLINLDTFKRQKKIEFYANGFYDYDTKKFISHSSQQLEKGIVINSYKENNMRVFITLSCSCSYFNKCTQKDLKHKNIVYNILNPNYIF